MNLNSYNSDDVIKGLKNLNFDKGDYIFIHSSIKSLGKYKDHKFPDLLSLIKNTLFEIIGSNGTIIVPTFNFDFAKGIDFNVNRTPSQLMGVFSEYIRNNNASNRTDHPFHSISILGNNSKHISNLKSKTEFSPGSAFDYLVQKNCKILFLGNCFTETFFHIAENNEEPEPKIDLDKLKLFLDNQKILNYSFIKKSRIISCNSKDYVNLCTKKLQLNPFYFLKKN